MPSLGYAHLWEGKPLNERKCPVAKELADLACSACIVYELFKELAKRISEAKELVDINIAWGDVLQQIQVLENEKSRR